MTFGTGPALAATGWEQVDPGPPARAWHAMAYDGTRDRLVLFGGDSDLGGILADTWERDGLAWASVTPAVSPPARSGHALAFDSVSHRTILFGGLDGPSGTTLRDTWEWDGTSWVNVTPEQSPPARTFHALAFDGRRARLVLFGGIDLGSGSLADTWEWDGTSWVNVTPAAGPPARWGHALAYDDARGRVVLFGGYDVRSGSLADTWEWDGVSWTRATPTAAPAARYGHSLSYDGARRRVVLFGGSDTGGAMLADTWEWDGTSWANVTPAVSPPARTFHALAYDIARDRVVLFGGDGTCCNLADAWERGMQPETTCDGLDDNADGRIDEGCDDDADDWCDAVMTVAGSPPACPHGAGDCDDADPSVHPGAAETCDGEDDDCDGAADEGLGSTTCGQGACQVTVQSCVGGVTQTCTPGAPTFEVCNGVDDDCDGAPDDGMSVATTCGAGACRSTGVIACVSGVLQPDTCTPGTPTAEVCNGVDDDCDGAADDGNPGGGAACSTGLLGVCSAGTQTCSGGSLRCLQAVTPSTETCNGLDDDCDGSADEALGSTTCGQGACRVTMQSCVGGVTQTCTPGAPSSEVCNSVDDDCDGAVDEGNPGGGTACITGRPGVCAAGTERCTGGSLICVETIGPSAETCNGLDDDCDGVADDGNPGGGAACNTGQPGVCAAGTTACSGGNPVCVQTIQPSVETCNGLDDDCDGIADDAVVGCTLSVTSPTEGMTMSCQDGSTPPAISWTPGPYDKYRVLVAWSPSFASGEFVSSGSRWLGSNAWTVPRKKWDKACAHPTLYIRVYGLDRDVGKNDPARRGAGPVRTVGTRH